MAEGGSAMGFGFGQPRGFGLPEDTPPPSGLGDILQNLIVRFVGGDWVYDLTLPPSLTRADRAVVHAMAEATGGTGLMTSIEGRMATDENGCMMEDIRLTISKQLQDRMMGQGIRSLGLTDGSIQNILNLDMPQFQRGHASNNASWGRREQHTTGATSSRNRQGRQGGGNSGSSRRNQNRRPLPPPRTAYSNRLSFMPAPNIPRSVFPRWSETEGSKTHLPIRDGSYKTDILAKLRTFKCVLVQGESGCGKTTQIPQFILEDAAQRKEKVRMICILPRRITAISVCGRVASERGEDPGNTVGFQIRLESAISITGTLLTYCTPPVFLRSMMTADYSILKNLTHVIVDDIHERDVQTLVVLAMLREVWPRFPNLSLVLMGGEMNTSWVSEYFYSRTFPMVQICGRPYPVDTKHLDDIDQMMNGSSPELLRLDQGGMVSGFESVFAPPPCAPLLLGNTRSKLDMKLLMKTLTWIHVTARRNDGVLVFLPGYEDIAAVKYMIFHSPEFTMKRRLADEVVVFLLHPAMQSGDQKAVFERPPGGKRKIILTTDESEAGLTIGDIAYVVDTGKTTERVFDVRTGASEEKTKWISKSSADQRLGRAGRCGPGFCFRLYSQAEYNNFAQFPETLVVGEGSSLQQLCLFVRAFLKREGRIEDFMLTRLVESPGEPAVLNSIKRLSEVGALDLNQDLTELGIYMLDLPLDPYLAKGVMIAVVLRCLDPVLTLMCISQLGDPFLYSADAIRNEMTLENKLDTTNSEPSDHLAFLKAFQDWEKSNMFDEQLQTIFCERSGLSGAYFELVYGLRAQVLGQIRGFGFIHQTSGANDLKELNPNSNNWALVKGILTGTVYPNLCCLDRDNNILWNQLDINVAVDPSSVVALGRSQYVLPSDWIVYDELTAPHHPGTAQFINQCTVVSDVCVAMFAGDSNSCPVELGRTAAVRFASFSENPSLDHVKRFRVNDWITLRGSENAVDAVMNLRGKMMKLIEKRWEDPTDPLSEADKNVIAAVARILADEDAARGFVMPEGVGQWPKWVAGNVLSAPRSGYDRSAAPSDANEIANFIAR